MHVEQAAVIQQGPPASGVLRHIPALDGIRGFAILLVLGYHLLGANPNTGHFVLDQLSSATRGMWMGVDLFFVLSGFLITGILYDSLGGRQFLRNFFGRRMLRIFPLYYGILILLLILTNPLHLVWHGMQWHLLLYLQNFGLGMSPFDYLPSPRINLGGFWSLAIEEQFYLVWPFLILLLRRPGRIFAAALTLSGLTLLLRVVLVQRGVNPDFIYCATVCRTDSLLLGGCLAMALRSRWRGVVIRNARFALAAALGGILAIGWYQHSLGWHDGHVMKTYGFSVIAMAGVSLIAETFREASWVHALFQFSGFRFLGRYSYGLYVFHPTIAACLLNSFRASLLHVSHSRAVSVAGGAVLVTGISIVVAMLSFHLYERHFLNLKSYFVEAKRVPASSLADDVETGGRVVVTPLTA